MIEWVIVRGYRENTGKNSPDVWTESCYQVFRRITENANAAMLNFHSPVYPELAVRYWNQEPSPVSRGQIFSQRPTSLQTHSCLIPIKVGAFFRALLVATSSLQSRYEFVVRLCIKLMKNSPPSSYQKWPQPQDNLTPNSNLLTQNLSSGLNMFV
jgi:hypothetical protein